LWAGSSQRIGQGALLAYSGSRKQGGNSMDVNSAPGRQAGSGNAAAGIIFEGDQSSFMRDVVAASREIPVLVDFWAASSAACNTLSSTLEKVTIAAGGRLRLVKIDIDKNRQLVSQLTQMGLSLESAPIVVGFWNGQIHDLFQGALSEADVIGFAESLLTAARGQAPISEKPTAAAASAGEVVNSDRKNVDKNEGNLEMDATSHPELVNSLAQAFNQKIQKTQTHLDELDRIQAKIKSDIEELESQKRRSTTERDAVPPLPFDGLFKFLFTVGIFIFFIVLGVNHYLQNEAFLGILVAGLATIIPACAIFLRDFVANGRIRANLSVRIQQISSRIGDARQQLTDSEAVRREIEADWAKSLNELQFLVQATDQRLGLTCAPWISSAWSDPRAATDKKDFLRLGAIERRVTSNHQLLSQNSIHPLMTLPSIVAFPGNKGLALEATSADSRSAALSSLRSLALRLIATAPPGKLRFTMMDPVGLGQNFASLLKFGDHAEELIASRPWSSAPHIEAQLARLTQDIENIIQKYIRDDYINLDQYNLAAGKTAEPYRVLLIADFPVNFSENAVNELIRIAENGPRCGVFPIIVFDRTKPLPYGIDVDHVLQRFVAVRDGLVGDEGRDSGSGLLPPGWQLRLDAEPQPQVSDSVISVVGPLAAEGMKVSIPYRDLLRHSGVSAPAQCWPAERSTKESLVVPLGPRDAGRYQELVLGRGVLHSALVVGMPGSGKSNLLHALITSTALLYPPSEVELYLIDLKPGGIEFERYAQIGLPHARVIAVDSEREFGLAVLRALDNEMEERGNRCRSHGNNLATFRSNTGELMPRVVLVIDEFLVLFETNDRIASEAINIIGRLVRLGRAFGIHLILASQTLRGSESLPKSLIDLISIRIVLQCSDADAKAALADDNHAAALLSRPGEGIFNDKIGAIEGNSRFQVAAMGDDTEHRALLKEYIEPLSRRLGREARRPVVFRGDEPAQLSACQPLLRLLSENSWPARRPYCDIWLGEPLSLDQPTSLRIMRQSGAHGLFVVRDEDQGVSLLHAALLALAAQNAPGDARFFVADMTNADRPWRARTRALAKALPHEPYVTETSRGLHGVLEDLGSLVERRSKDEDQSGESIFLMLMGVQKMRTLREDDAGTYTASGIAGVGDADGSDGTLPGRSPNERLTTILRDGPEVGVHILAWGDALAGVMRVMDRRMIGSMSLRVAGPMSEQDSQNFLDVPAAARIQRPHRLIRLDDNDPGSLGQFRPYLVASSEWIENAAQLLASRSP
jgi:thioredoxin-like negative regulator of GroEL